MKMENGSGVAGTDAKAGCPFDWTQVEAARAFFFKNADWRRVYDNAPPGAKRRLDASFWFSRNLAHRSGETPASMWEDYRRWRMDVERAMTEGDLEYMIESIDKEATREHYATLLRERRTGLRDHCGVKLMSCSDFFAMLDRKGEFESFEYSAETKRSILDEFGPVLEGSGDPLEDNMEDILATAELKEVRVYPSDETMYVRVMTRFLDDTAQWSEPYQMVAAWDCFHNLQGYAFPIGKGTRSNTPLELESFENTLQHQKRMELFAKRMGTWKGADSPVCITT